MSTTQRANGRAPWITAGVLGVVTALLAVVLLVLILPNRDQNAGLTKNEQAAVNAAKQYVINQMTYSRATFEQDFARTLAGTTGALKSDLLKDKNNLKAAMDSGKFDLSGAVSDVAFAEGTRNQAAILVSAKGFKVTSAGKLPTSSSRFKITMTKVDGKWLASNLTTVGLV